MWTAQFDRFTAPARARPQLWRLLVGTIFIFGCWFAIYLGTIAAVGIYAVATLPPGAPTTDDGLPAWFADFLLGRTPTGVVVTLFTFAGMMIGGLLAGRWLHSRRARDLFGPRIAPDFLMAMLITFAIGGLSFVFLGPGDVSLVENTPRMIFLTFLPAALLGLLIQTGAEELIFRGYLQTQLAARFDSPLVWMLVPSILFGLLHVDVVSMVETGALAPNDGLVFLTTGLLGLLAADLTRVTGSIGAAWGLHFANNCQALLIVTLDDVLSGLSLWKLPFGRDDIDVLPLWLVQDMITIVILWACIRLWLARSAASGAAPR